MDKPIYCRIQIKGHLSDQWHNWFGGLEIENQPNGQALFHGMLADQAALYSVLNRMRDFGLSLLSLKCVEMRYKTANEKAVEGDDVWHPSREK